MEVSNFTYRPLYPWKRHRYPMKKWLGGAILENNIFRASRIANGRRCTR